jgi:hypothetical protein
MGTGVLTKYALLSAPEPPAADARPGPAAGVITVLSAPPTVTGTAYVGLGILDSKSTAEKGRLNFAWYTHLTLRDQCRWPTLTTTSRHLRTGVCEPKALSAMA